MRTTIRYNKSTAHTQKQKLRKKVLCNATIIVFITLE